MKASPPLRWRAAAGRHGAPDAAAQFGKSLLRIAELLLHHHLSVSRLGSSHNNDFVKGLKELVPALYFYLFSDRLRFEKILFATLFTFFLEITISYPKLDL